MGTAHSSVLGGERAGVIDCGLLLGGCIIPVTGMYVPGTGYIFGHHVYRGRRTIRHLTAGQFNVTGVPLFLVAFLVSS